MEKIKRSSGRHRWMNKRWTQSAALVVVVAIFGFASGVALLDREGDVGPVGPVATTTTFAPRTEPANRAVELEAPGARGADGGAERRARGVRTPGVDLRARKRAAQASPDARVSALRDLEQRDRAAAALAALALVDDPAPLVRLNAVAILARNPSPAGERALASMDPEARRLAQALAERR